MKKTLFAFAILAALAPVLRAGEGADPATALLPKNTVAVVRVASLDRVDAVTKRLLPLIRAIAPEQAGMLERTPASETLRGFLGLDATIALDRTRPFYAAMGEDGPTLLLLPAAEGASWEGEKALPNDNFAVLRGGTVVVTDREGLGLEARGTPFEIQDGDVTLHVRLRELIARHEQDIRKGISEGLSEAKEEMPEKLAALFEGLGPIVESAVFGVDTFEYSLHFEKDGLYGEGLLRTREGSELRKFFARAGAPGTNDLAAYLPKNALIVADSNLAPDWPAKEMTAFVENAFGAGAGEALRALYGGVNSAGLSGRQAMAMSFTGMMTAASYGIAEVEDAEKVKAGLQAMDPSKANKALADAEIPLKIIWEPGVAKHGETELHRMRLASDDPTFAAFAMGTTTYICVEGDYMLSVSSMTAESEIRSFIDRIREGDKTDHPHLKAVAALGRAHNVAFSLNLGALKPMAMMFAGMSGEPAVARVVREIPDDLMLTTAISFTGGDVHWRGDWPLEEVTKIAKIVAEIQKEKAIEQKERRLEDDYE